MKCFRCDDSLECVQSRKSHRAQQQNGVAVCSAAGVEIVDCDQHRRLRLCDMVFSPTGLPPKGSFSAIALSGVVLPARSQRQVRRFGRRQTMPVFRQRALRCWTLTSLK
ncbi:hypothetical protein IE4872_PD00986 (plasmid) [Rhizobium gallicum]|uniref:Uncharacterized protein n=1 Tax=Rhizobium gallicum TaxID=56730 RepID=A0A1L5NUD2_9HYPH|nr:hypothetical protein IE4872_PD00986 [Rhizobium gallicum]